MKIDDLKYKISEFWNEFRRDKAGVFGLVLIVIFMVTMLLEKFVSPYPEANKQWREIAYWENNVKSAKPIWVNMFLKNKLPTTTTMKNGEVKERQRTNVKEFETSFEYDFKWGAAPSDLVLEFDSVGEIQIIPSITRPDGQKILGEKVTYNTKTLKKNRIALKPSMVEGAYKFATQVDYVNASTTQKIAVDSLGVAFGEAKEFITKKPVGLPGVYTIKVKIISPSPNVKVDNFKLTAVGKVAGLMGTDNFKRDIFSGLIAGVKWAFIIGFLVALSTVVIGVIYGVVSAYYGGIVDAVMQRIVEFLMNIPFLPVLIVVSAILKPSIWTFIVLMVALNWIGPVRVVRSMALQIKEETFIEASKALGASNFRLIFKHMLPLVIPFAFANMALAVPSAILSEAGISILGLGDSTIVTWGQMLQDAKSGGALITGMWWWIIPPGIMISLVGMSFSFVGFAMDKILNPKLKTR